MAFNKNQIKTWLVKYVSGILPYAECGGAKVRAKPPREPLRLSVESCVMQSFVMRHR